MYQSCVWRYSVILALTLAIGPIGLSKEAESTSLDADPNLMTWWKFDETAGKTAVDTSKHGRNGTLKGNLSFENHSVPGKMGKAIQFDGDTALIEVTGYKGIAGTHCRTVAAWIKTTATQGQILSWGTDDFGKMWNFGFIRGRVGVTPHGGYLYMNQPTHDDKWHHVAAVVREAELPNLYDDVTLYLDGTIAEIHDIGLLDLWPIETGSDLNIRIGQRFKGCLDDLRIYDRALSDEEIQALYKPDGNRPSPEAKP